MEGKIILFAVVIFLQSRPLQKINFLTENQFLSYLEKISARDERAGDRGCGLQGTQTRPSSRGIIKFGGEWNSP
jgi:hypothetical protein